MYYSLEGRSEYAGIYACPQHSAVTRKSPVESWLRDVAAVAPQTY